MNPILSWSAWYEIKAYLKEREQMQTETRRSFWDKHRSDAVFAEKRDLADTGESFAVWQVTQGKSKFGPVWHVSIELHDGERQILTFSQNPQRDSLLADLRDACQETRVECQLVSFQTAGGMAYTLAPPDEERPRANPETGEILPF